MKYRFSPGQSWSGFLGLTLLAASVVYTSSASAAGDPQAAMMTLEKYVRATYARDYDEAYSYIAARDQRLKTRASYIRERGAFSGFTLEVARQIASYIRLHAAEKRLHGEQAAIRVRLKVPDAGKLAPLLHDWDSDRLEALPVAERRTVLLTIAQLHRDGKLDMVDAEDTFELVKEGDAWRIVLDWAAGIKVNFEISIPESVPVQARIVRAEIASRPGEAFNVALRIKNTGDQMLFARIGHLVDPHEFRDYLDLVECGFLLPVRLSPGKEEEFTSTYLLRGNLPEGVRSLSVTYALTPARE